MIACQLCGREFKNELGISIHLARVHHIRGDRERLSLKTIHNFYPLLKKRRWTAAEGFLKLITEKRLDDEWIEGYVHALAGMIEALKANHPPQPYIVELKRYDGNQLQVTKEEFLSQSTPLSTEFDLGYFRAWVDYIRYLLYQQSRHKRTNNIAPAK
jgi:hypothetical protein